MKKDLSVKSLVVITLVLWAGCAFAADSPIRLTCSAPHGKAVVKALAKAGQAVVAAACPTCQNLRVTARLKNKVKASKTELTVEQLVDSSILQYSAAPAPTATPAPVIQGGHDPAAAVALAGTLSIVSGSTIALPSAACQVEATVTFTVRYKDNNESHKSTWSGDVTLAGAWK